MRNASALPVFMKGAVDLPRTLSNPKLLDPEPND